jgi:hypothetical protein
MVCFTFRQPLHTTCIEQNAGWAPELFFKIPYQLKNEKRKETERSTNSEKNFPVENL